ASPARSLRIATRRIPKRLKPATGRPWSSPKNWACARSAPTATSASASSTGAQASASRRASTDVTRLSRQDGVAAELGLLHEVIRDVGVEKVGAFVSCLHVAAAVEDDPPHLVPFEIGDDLLLHGRFRRHSRLQLTRSRAAPPGAHTGRESRVYGK